MGNTGFKGGGIVTEFICGTRILSGTGAVARLGSLGIRRLLLVTDPFFAKNGMAAKVAAASGAGESRIFDRVQPDPTVTLAAEGAVLAREFQPDAVVALGGGSAMDCAKAMAYFSGICPRLIAIPTTSGSGSEVTDFAILTHGAGKYPLVDPKLRPDVAILDDGLLGELPPVLIADGGFDLLSHALEALAGKNAGPITDALATGAFCTGFAGLPASFAGDRSLRLPVHQAATMAGMAFTQAGLGVCHALAHSLGGHFHLPHGRLNAILLPSVVEYNAPAAGEKYGALARAAGLGGSSDAMAVRNLKNGLVRLRRRLSMPGTLAEAGIAPALLAEHWQSILRQALADPCCETNPVPVTAEGLEALLCEVTGRG